MIGNGWNSVTASGTWTGSVTLNTTLSVDDLSFSRDLSIYPNPAKESFNLKLTGFNNAESVAVDVYDLTGKIVKSFTGSRNLDITSLNSGIYMVRVSDNNAVETKRLVVAR